MANRYDQIEAGQGQQGNRYDQIEAAQGNDPFGMGQIPATTPPQHYRWRDIPGAALKNVVQSAANFGGSVVHAYEHPVETSESLVKMGLGAPSALINAAGGGVLNALSPDVRQMVVSQAPTVLQPMVTANNKLGQAASAVLQGYKDRYFSGGDAFKAALAEHPIEALADAATFLPGAGAVVKGAAAASANPLVHAGGALVGKGLEVAGAAANPLNALKVVKPALTLGGNVTRAVANVSPIGPGREGMMLLDATEGRPQAVLNALNGGSPRVIVSGSVPTATQVLAPGGLPTGGIGATLGATPTVSVPTKLAALGAAAAAHHPTEAMDLRTAQNAARLAQIRSIGDMDPRFGGDFAAAISDAEAAREAQAARDYGVAFPVMSRADDDLLDLFSRPSMDRVLARAREISAEKGQPFQVGQNIPAVPAHSIPSSILGANGKPVMINVPAQPAQYAQYSGANLHTMKQAFDDLAFDPVVKNRYGIGNAELNAIRGTRGDFIDWVESKNPAYAAARQNYADASNPIDRMKIGQYLEAKLMDPTLGDDTVAPRANAYAAALDNATNEALGNSTIRKATGQNRYIRLGDVLTPGEMAAANGVKDDLARAKLAEAQAQAASQYKSKLGGTALDTAGVQLPAVISGPVNWLNRKANEKAADNVGNALLSPDATATALRNALAAQARLNALSAGIKKGAKGVQAIYPFPGINKYPAAYNALQMERDDRAKKNSLGR